VGPGDREHATQVVRAELTDVLVRHVLDEQRTRETAHYGVLLTTISIGAIAISLSVVAGNGRSPSSTWKAEHMAIRIKIKIEIDAEITDEASVSEQAREFYEAMDVSPDERDRRAAAIDRMVSDPLNMVQNLLDAQACTASIGGVTFLGSLTEVAEHNDGPIDMAEPSN
jgi:hypothetical protein